MKLKYLKNSTPKNKTLILNEQQRYRLSFLSVAQSVAQEKVHSYHPYLRRCHRDHSSVVRAVKPGSLPDMLREAVNNNGTPQANVRHSCGF